LHHLLVDVTRLGRQVVVTPRGELDVMTAPMLRHHLSDLIDGQGNLEVTVDLAELSFIDSTGLNLLVEANGSLGEKGGQFSLAAPSRHVRKVMEICGLTSVIAISEHRPTRRSWAS
jgi:anti-sigma B factor antagonist